MGATLRYAKVVDADDGYQVIFEIDGREVARVDFPVLAHDAALG